MSDTATKPRLKTRYADEVRSALTEQFAYDNVMQVPGVVKVVVNMGVGDAAKDSKLIEGAIRDLAAITGQEIVWTHRVAPGGADRSYGVHVARMAGVPIDFYRGALSLFAHGVLDDAKEGPFGARTARFDDLHFGSLALEAPRSGSCSKLTHRKRNGLEHRYFGCVWQKRELVPKRLQGILAIVLPKLRLLLQGVHVLEERVVGGFAGIAAMAPVADGRRIDDVGIDRPDMLDVDLQLLPGGGKVVRQEDVGVLAQFVDDLLALGRADIDADGALAAVGMLDERMAQRIQFDPAHVEEAALGIATHRVLDLDHIRTPVRQDRAGCRSECKLRHFENANALHYLGCHDRQVSFAKTDGWPVYHRCCLGVLRGFASGINLGGCSGAIPAHPQSLRYRCNPQISQLQ